VSQIIALDQADAVLAGHGALHFNGPLDHAVDDALGDFLFLVAEEDDGWNTVRSYTTERALPSQGLV
jgi:hypothetical protein